ncbi:glutathione S-transferase family protein [Faunimonas sp. B44]|uniref:glutathione S-transferase family protein n=1 Tax=Faunimonas sp. B44 TaxID=3461493 RepID=UPI004044EB62
MMKIWGRISSINVQKVVWCAGEVGIPFERIDAGLAFGINNTPEFKEKNPNGLVPLLEEDDGWTLWESNAIVRYLAARHSAGNLWPEDPRERALSDRWMDWQTTAFAPAFIPAFMGLVRTPPEKRDQAAIDAAMQRGEGFAAILDQHLGGNAYVGGERFTMGDIPAACIAHRWLNMPAERTPRPNMERWYREVLARPAVAGVLTAPLA